MTERPRIVAALVLLAAAPARPAAAHAAVRHLTGGEVAGWWTWEPGVVILLLAAVLFYAVGLARIWGSAGSGRGIRRWEAACFAVGWLALVAALLSPLDALSGILFSAHMAQHELLMLVAAPLLVLGRPLIPLLWALPRPRRDQIGQWTKRPAFRRGWHAATTPLAVFAIHGAALWIWHLPRLYEATLGSDAVHTAQHLSFLGSAALFWWALVHGRYGRGGYGIAVLYVFATAAHSGALGALLVFAPHVLYPIYEGPAREWGLRALEDQQLAGLIMWIPSGLVFIAMGLLLFAAWLGEAARRVARSGLEGRAARTSSPPAAIP